MAQSTRRPEPIDALTGWRFIAAFSVLIAHASNWLMHFDPPVGTVMFLGWSSAIGMPLFFVLSGFVIHYNYSQSFLTGFVGPTIDFFIARFARLYPLYIFALILFLGVHGVIGSILGGANFAYLGRYLLLTQAWSIEYRGNLWFGVLLLPLAWSISVEVFFYVLYPCIARWLIAIASVRRAAIVFATIVAGYYGAMFLCYLNFDALHTWGNKTFLIDADPTNALLFWVFNTGPIGRVWEFLMGAVVAQAYLQLHDRPPSARENRLGSIGLTATVLLGVIFYIAGHYNPIVAFSGSYGGGFAPIAGLLIFGSARYTSPISRFLASRPMIALGDASYSIYLLHEFTLDMLRRPETFSPSWANVVTWVIMMTVGVGFTLIIALGVYRVLEVPSRNYLRRTLHRGKVLLPLQYLPSSAPPWIAPLLALFVVIGGESALNALRPGLIHIVEANYGANCATVDPPPPYVNSYHRGNMTLILEQYIHEHCNRERLCSYQINLSVMHDPVAGCAKGFSATYRCGTDPTLRTAVVPAEAFLSTVTFDCR